MRKCKTPMRTRGFAAEKSKGSDWLLDQPIITPSSGSAQPRPDQVSQLDAARARLDASVLLLEHALDLREQLWWSIDLDDARAEVAALKYAVKAHRWWRSQ